MSSVNFDPTDPANISGKVLSEEETRKRVLAQARKLGCEKEAIIIYKKIYNDMRLCGNDKERKNIAEVGVRLLYDLFDSYGDMYADGKLICSKS